MELFLAGCRAEPLAGYLKALAVFRLLAQQKDPGVGGRWQGSTFVLDSDLDRNNLLHFFLEEYRPTPVVAPWNGGSGFYEGNVSRGVESLRRSKLPRFAAYRETIERVLDFPELPGRNVSLGEMLALLDRETLNTRPGKTRNGLLLMTKKVKEGLRELGRVPTFVDPEGLTVEILSELVAQVPRNMSEGAKVLLKEVKKMRTACNKFSRTGEKENLIMRCRAELGDECLDWLDTAALLGNDAKPVFPPLLAMGGIEGHFDYSNRFMQCLTDLLVSPLRGLDVGSLLENSLFARPAAGFLTASFGQFDPGRAGGYNQGMGVEQKDFPINPWDFVLAMEGAITWSGGVTRRLGSRRGGNRYASPFTVRAKSIGYASAADGREPEAKAEIWTPIWERRAIYPEIRALLAEGRAEVGRRLAADTIGFAEAASSLGVDRGVTGFVRFSLVKRRGDSFLALPAGYFPVKLRTESDLVRELEKPLGLLDGFLGQFRKNGGEVPASLANARRRIDEAILNLLVRGGEEQVRGILSALGRMERLLARRDPVKKPSLHRPLFGLNPLWAKAAGLGRLEVRVAAAVASIGTSSSATGPFRANLAPINPRKPWEFSADKNYVAWVGNSLPRRMAAVLTRRLLEAERSGEEGNPLRGLLSLTAEDVAAFIAGNLDEILLEELLFGFSLVDWGKRAEVAGLRTAWGRQPICDIPVPRAYALLKILFLPHPMPTRATSTEKVNLRPPGNLLPLLLAGRVGAACETARRRLFASGFATLGVRFPEDCVDGTRLAGALLVPVRGTERLARMVSDYGVLGNV